MVLDRANPIARYHCWLIRFYNDDWVAEDKINRGTNLCAFFWGLVFRTTGILVLALLGFGLIYLIGYIAITSPWDLVLGVGIIAGLLVAAAVMCFVIDGLRKVGRSENIVITYIKSAKRGVCPLIQFGDSD